MSAPEGLRSSQLQVLRSLQARAPAAQSPLAETAEATGPAWASRCCQCRVPPLEPLLLLFSWPLLRLLLVQLLLLLPLVGVVESGLSLHSRLFFHRDRTLWRGQLREFQLTPAEEFDHGSTPRKRHRPLHRHRRNCSCPHSLRRCYRRRQCRHCNNHRHRQQQLLQRS